MKPDALPEAATQEGLVIEWKNSPWWSTWYKGGDAFIAPPTPCCCRDWPQVWEISCCRGLSAPRGLDPPGTNWWETWRSTFRVGHPPLGLPPRPVAPAMGEGHFFRVFHDLTWLGIFGHHSKCDFCINLNFSSMYVFNACHLQSSFSDSS